MTVRAWAHFLLFGQERQTKVDNGPERLHPVEKEGRAGGAGLWGSRPWKIPFDPPYLWRASLLFLACGTFLLQHFLKPPKVNTAKSLFLQLHPAMSAPPSRKRGGRVSPQRSTPPLIRMLTRRARITMCWHQA